jgi:uncharacterized membrane protein
MCASRWAERVFIMTKTYAYTNSGRQLIYSSYKIDMDNEMYDSFILIKTTYTRKFHDAKSKSKQSLYYVHCVLAVGRDGVVL